MAMTNERRNQIAWELLKRHIIREFPLRDLIDGNSLKKGIGQLAQETGMPKEELLEFIKQIVEEILQGAKGELQKISFSK